MVFLSADPIFVPLFTVNYYEQHACALVSLSFLICKFK